MPKKSTIENKNIYLSSREDAGLSRAAASEQLFVSEDRIERFEKLGNPNPEEVALMAKVYKKPSLCNYYCSHDCPIGQDTIPEIKESSLSQITVELLASLNRVEKYKNRFVEIVEDGNIDDYETTEFEKIETELEKLSLVIDSLKLWIDNKKIR